ncbi:MAG: response regulator [Leptolyngbya sp. SIO1D8]|nr:response regulator [Leptolyngbya sp. SIO1D8]
MWNDAEILVVDDTPANLEVITETLASVGFTVAAVTSGERALKRLNTYIPDLILLDVRMPGMDGFETCQKIKASPDTINIPIIFITAASDTESILKGFSCGAVDYLTKPFREPELLARVKNHIQLRQMSYLLEQRVAERTQDLETALVQLKQSQLQLIQKEKMSALGNLVAGVAHEINNPIGFLTGNINPVREYVGDLLNLIDLFLAKTPDLDAELKAAIKTVDLDFLRQDLPQLFDSMTLGGDRIRNISHSLRIFCRADRDTKTTFNLHDGLDSTLLILQHRLKPKDDRPAINVIKHYGDLPELECFPGQLNQVFMNILANAIDAIEDRDRTLPPADREATPGQITIKTALANQQTIIHIQDNGPGMTEAVKQRVFDHLYTTKVVGQGTGLGLAIAKQVIVDNHGGSIQVESEPGQGTEFILTLPI